MARFSAANKNKGRITPNSAYDRQMPKSEKLRGDKRKPLNYSCANHEKDFGGNEYGGDGTHTVLGSGKMSIGLGSRVGTQKHHGAAKAAENRSPKNAHDFADFGVAGGTAKKPTLG